MSLSTCEHCGGHIPLGPNAPNRCEKCGKHIFDPYLGANMREVTKDEFYRVIGPQNVIPSPQGNWPYTSMFKTPSGEVRGKVVGFLSEGSAFEQKRYYLPE